MIAVLRIEIEDISPLIWRRISVRTSINLDKLHEVIQLTMGWHNSHLWMFTAHDRNYSILIPNDDMWNERISDATKTKLSALLTSGTGEINYVYDFGDNWQHRIIVESVKAAEAEKPYPQFVGGERRCPPKDCGGVPGYYDFLKKIASKQGKKRKAALDWYGGPYDPNDIDERQIAVALKRV